MITGTYLDLMNDLLPSSNWGPDDWKREIASCKADGIDTLVLSRAGRDGRALLDTPSLRAADPALLAPEDLLAHFLGLAQEHGLALWFATWDAGRPGDDRAQAALNRALCEEVWERYGRSASFRGWHLARPIDELDATTARPWCELAQHLRQISGLPVLASLSARALDAAERLPLAELADVLLLDASGLAPARLDRELVRATERTRARGLVPWARVDAAESFPGAGWLPIAWPKLARSLEAAQAAGAEKIVVWEHARFLAPHSIYPAAHNLHRRYREWLAER